MNTRAAAKRNPIRNIERQSMLNYTAEPRKQNLTGIAAGKRTRIKHPPFLYTIKFLQSSLKAGALYNNIGNFFELRRFTARTSLHLRSAFSVENKFHLEQPRVIQTRVLFAFVFYFRLRVHTSGCLYEPMKTYLVVGIVFGVLFLILWNVALDEGRERSGIGKKRWSQVNKAVHEGMKNKSGFHLKIRESSVLSWRFSRSRERAVEQIDVHGACRSLRSLYPSVQPP